MIMFLDMEFTGLHQQTTPISLALRAHDGHELYAEFIDYDVAQVNPWILEHVINNLILPERKAENAGPIGTVYVHGRQDVVHYNISAWLDQFDKVTIVGDCLAYDWVLFCELFGGAKSLPDHMSYIPIELCTVLALHGFDPDASREEMVERLGASIPGTQHNALHDVRVLAEIWNFLEFDATNRAIMIDPIFYREKVVTP